MCESGHHRSSSLLQVPANMISVKMLECIRYIIGQADNNSTALIRDSHSFYLVEICDHLPNTYLECPNSVRAVIHRFTPVRPNLIRGTLLSSHHFPSLFFFFFFFRRRH